MLTDPILPLHTSPTNANTVTSTALTITTAIALFLEHRSINALPRTVEFYDKQLRAWTRWRDAQHLPSHVAEIGVDELRRYIAYLTNEHQPYASGTQRPPAPRQGLAAGSVDAAWRSIRALWTFLTDEGALSKEQQTFFPRRVPRPRLLQQIRPIYEEGQIEKLLKACDDNPDLEQRLRDRAIILMLVESGMRVAELCSLQDEQLQLAKQQTRITGKGGKERWAYWGPRTAAALTAYLARRPGPHGGPLFRSSSPKPQLRGKKLLPNGVRQLLRRLSQRAGVTLVENGSVHAFRHTFAHQALDAGVDGLHLQQLLGHTSAATTARYVRENDTRLRTIHSRIWRRKGGNDDALGLAVQR